MNVRIRTAKKKPASRENAHANRSNVVHVQSQTDKLMVEVRWRRLTLFRASTSRSRDRWLAGSRCTSCTGRSPAPSACSPVNTKHTRSHSCDYPPVNTKRAASRDNESCKQYMYSSESRIMHLRPGYHGVVLHVCVRKELREQGRSNIRGRIRPDQIVCSETVRLQNALHNTKSNGSNRA